MDDLEKCIFCQYILVEAYLVPMYSGAALTMNLLKAADLILHTPFNCYPHQWNSPLIKSLYSPSVASFIMETPISFSRQDDYLYWTGNASGRYTFKDGFRKCFQSSLPSYGTQDSFWKFLWSLSLPYKYLLLIWKLLHSCLSSGDPVMLHHMPVDILCTFGCDTKETLEVMLDNGGAPVTFTDTQRCGSLVQEKAKDAKDIEHIISRITT